MTSIGDTLRRERLKRNLAVAKIAGDLKISARFLDAIEAEDFAKLPGGVFTKSFVRQYAAYLGLDPAELVAEVQRTVEPEPPAEVADKPKPDVPGIRLGFRDDWQSISEHRYSLPSWMKAGALLLFLMLVCSGVYWWWERPRHVSTALETPPSNRVIPTPPPAATPAPPPAAKPATPPPMDAVVVPTADPTATPTAATPVQTPPAPVDVVPILAPNPNASVHVSILAVDDRVWIGAYVKGKYLFSGTLQVHESRNIDADGEVRLRIGNAGSAAITLNGKRLDSVGPKGQVRTVVLTSAGSQIVAPDKPINPLDRF